RPIQLHFSLSLKRPVTKAPATGRGFCGGTNDSSVLSLDRFGRLRRWGGCGRGFGIGLADVDAALEIGAIFNADAGGGHVAGEGALGANVDAVGRGDISLDLAQDHDFTGVDAGGYLAVATDGEAVAGQIDAAF